MITRQTATKASNDSAISNQIGSVFTGEEAAQNVIRDVDVAISAPGETRGTPGESDLSVKYLNTECAL